MKKKIVIIGLLVAIMVSVSCIYALKSNSNDKIDKDIPTVNNWGSGGFHKYRINNKK